MLLKTQEPAKLDAEVVAGAHQDYQESAGPFPALPHHRADRLQPVILRESPEPTARCTVEVHNTIPRIQNHEPSALAMPSADVNVLRKHEEALIEAVRLIKRLTSE